MLPMKFQSPLRDRGKLIGLESGSLTSHEDYKSHKRRALDGKLLGYIQAWEKGIITLAISSPGLRSFEIQLEAK